MVAPTTWLPRIYQRFQPFWDRATPSCGLALLLWASAEATGAYPREWRLFLAGLLFLVGLRWPAVAYAAFTFFISFPLYRISIYLAAIVLAVLVLTSNWAMRNLGAAVLVLITPALLPWHMEAAIPLLAGLWWGELTGALAGGLAALWLKLLAGMAGQPLDLVQLSGWTPTGGNIIDRFSAFNSLQTLLELVNPFADTSETLLLHVLQVFAWALAGYVAGWLARRTWTDRQRAWAPLFSVLPAVFILELCYILPPALGLGAPTQPFGLLNRLEEVIINQLDKLLLLLFVSGLAAAGARMFYLYLRRPLLRPAHRRAERAPLPKRQSRRPETDVGRPALDWKPAQRPHSTSKGDDDVIMLEID